jgi:hypothetical protein
VPDTTWLFSELEYSISVGFVKGYFAVTYPPDPLPLGIDEGKGELKKYYSPFSR